MDKEEDQQNRKIMIDTTSEDMMSPVTMEELSFIIDKLDSSKAEGLDSITNSMLKLDRAKI